MFLWTPGVLRTGCRVSAAARGVHLAVQPLSDSGYVLRCGLELHTQLDTTRKLFSLLPNQLDAPPNTNVSYFDCSLPGSQPVLNPEAVVVALRACVALGATVNTTLTFDRKHYFYPDQPLGYQITQHYSPLARGGRLTLHPHDGVDKETHIRIHQIQLEQDTGRLTYDERLGELHIDLNRANVPLIELVTEPDFYTVDAVRAFIRKYQLLVRHLGVSTGELELGAIRIDVNVSVNNGTRVELKNLSTVSAVTNAIRHEYRRQVAELQASGKTRLTDPSETRGWNGSATYRLRSKELAVDYRYMPDPELPPVVLAPGVVEEVREGLPEHPDAMMQRLMREPYSLRPVDARVLLNNREYSHYFHRLFAEATGRGIAGKVVSNWFFNVFMGNVHRVEEAEGQQAAEAAAAASGAVSAVSPDRLPLDRVLLVAALTSLMELVLAGTLTSTLGRLLLGHLVDNPQDRNTPLEVLVEEFDMAAGANASAVDETCRAVMAAHPKVVEDYRNGRLNSIKFLVGMCMRESAGAVKAAEFEERLARLLGST